MKTTELNQNSSTEFVESEVQKNKKTIRKSVKDILNLGYNSAIASSAISGLAGAIVSGVNGAIAGLTFGFGGGLIVGSIIGGAINIGRGIKNWRRK